MDAVKSLHFPKKRNYTIEEFKTAVKNSCSVRQVLMKLNLEPKGGNYRIFYNTVQYLSLDTTHFTGQGHNAGRRGKDHRGGRKKILLSELLVENSSFTSFKTKKRLLDEKILEPTCSQCSLSMWQGVGIPLELHHKNGINSDNRIENLCLLCPNCHALTPNYRSKNKSKA